MIKRYFKRTFRKLWRRPLFRAISYGVIALWAVLAFLATLGGAWEFIAIAREVITSVPAAY